MFIFLINKLGKAHLISLIGIPVWVIQVLCIILHIDYAFVEKFLQLKASYMAGTGRFIRKEPRNHKASAQQYQCRR